MRGFIELGFIFNPSFEQEVTVFSGEADSTSHYKLKFGGTYQYSPSVAILGALQIQAGDAKFIAPVRSIKAKDSSLQFGASYTF